MSEGTMSREYEIRARVEKATPGPWWFDYKAYQMRSRDDVLVTEDIISPDDQNFIAHAREDVPYLQDQLDMYKKLYDHALECVDKVFQDYSGHKAMLPDFMRLGESKFQGVIKLAEEYKKLLAENERLRRRCDVLEEQVGKTADEVCLFECEANYCPHCNNKIERGDSFTAYCDHCPNPDGGAYPAEPPLPMFWEETISKPRGAAE